MLCRAAVRVAARSARGRAARVSVAAIALSCLAATALGAQVVIANPSLPTEETVVYVERTGGATRMLRQDLRLHDGADGRWLELRTSTDDTDTTLRLDPSTLFATRSETTQRGADATVRRSMEVIEARSQPKSGELLVSDFASLAFVLRGLPWATFRSARVVPVGSSGRNASFSVQISLAGRETVTIGTNRWDCYKVQLGIDGFWGAFLGKSSYWYAVTPPHVMVRSEGPSGGPGSPVTVMELQSYSAR
ncbi:MAG TPA: hypothetical protein VHE79_02460 [Spirochaetia bacterium]